LLQKWKIELIDILNREAIENDGMNIEDAVADVLEMFEV
jgi:hypothetical protein